MSKIQPQENKYTGIKFSIYGSESYAYQGGVYNMLASFSVGLHKAFTHKNLETKYIDEYFQEQLLPHLSIGFNATAVDYWPTILENGATSIMWSVDSLFYNNLPLIQKYYNYNNFSCIALSNDDDEALKHFLPNLKKLYMPLAIDPKIWSSQTTEKPRDIVFLASIDDIEERMANLKNQLVKNPQIFDLYYDMYEYALKNPAKNFWEIYSFYQLTKNDINFYSSLLKELTYLVSYKRRIDLVKCLAKSGLNVAVWGNGPWQKYVGGNVKHMGSANLFDAIEIIKSSKIAINLQPMQILGGIHDRIINSSAANTLVFTDKNPEIYKSFGDSLCYINMPNFEGLTEQLKYYLTNDAERIAKAKTAQEITLKNHTWDARVDTILKNMIVSS